MLTSAAVALFSKPSVNHVVTPDSVKPGRLGPAVAGDRLVTLCIGELLPQAINRIHGGGSLAEMLSLDTWSIGDVGPAGEVSEVRFGDRQIAIGSI